MTDPSTTLCMADGIRYVPPSLDEFERSLHLPPCHPPIQPITSPEDKRQYRIITLNNGLSAFLCSDPHTDKSAASLDVNIGSFAEPDHAQGLAHFLEHMLFMGTEKYPDEQEYSLIINNHAGSQNAYTTSERTNYIFDVSSSSLNLVLDRFAQFFVSPLCLPSAVDRELLAVNNEHNRNIQSDYWRLEQVLDATSNPSHPIARFGTGNFETLRDKPKEQGLDIREELMKFYRSTYTSQLMKLCILGKESLDELQKMVEDSFSAIPNTGTARPDYRQIPVWLPEQMATLTRIVPVKPWRKLEMRWVTHPIHHQFQSDPGRLITHCLAHEGEGSLAAFLKKSQLVNELYSGNLETHSSYALCTLTLELTEEGLKRYEEILRLTFSYLRMLRATLEEEAPAKSKWKTQIWPEVRSIAEMDFRFREKNEAYDFVESIASQMSEMPPTHLLSGSLLQAYDHAALVELADVLVNPRKMRVVLLAPEFKDLSDLQTEKYYGAKYRIDRLSEDLIKTLEHPPTVDQFHLPPPNRFIATNFELKHSKKEGSDTYKIVPKRSKCYANGAKKGNDERDVAVGSDANADGPSTAAVASRTDASVPTPSSTATIISNYSPSNPTDLYYFPDECFGLPKGQVSILLSSPFPLATPLQRLMASMAEALIEDALSEISHNAHEAGITLSIYLSSQGLMLRLSGFNEKMRLLLNDVLTQVRTLRIQGPNGRLEQYQRLREQRLRSLMQYLKSSPLLHANDDLELLTMQRRWSVEEQLQIFEMMNPESLDRFMEEWIGCGSGVEDGDSTRKEIQVHIWMLVSGNLSESDAKQLGEDVTTRFNPRFLPPSMQPTNRCILLPTDKTFIQRRYTKNEEETNSVCLNVYQLEQDELDISDPSKGEPNWSIAAHLALLNHILGDALFDQLRTKETLGYMVRGFERRVSGVRHYCIAVQSSDVDAAYLNYRIEAFLAWFRTKRMEELIKETPDFLEQNKKAVYINLTEKEKNPGQVHDRLWSEVSHRRFGWDVNHQIARAVQRVTLESLWKFWDAYLAIDGDGGGDGTGNKRRKISIQYFARQHALPQRVEKETEELVAYANQRLVTKTEESSTSAAAATTTSDGTAAASASSSSSSKSTESIFLPPVPLDPRPIEYLDDPITFKTAQQLYPAFPRPVLA